MRVYRVTAIILTIGASCLFPLVQATTKGAANHRSTSLSSSSSSSSSSSLSTTAANHNNNNSSPFKRNHKKITIAETSKRESEHTKESSSSSTSKSTFSLAKWMANANHKNKVSAGSSSSSHSNSTTTLEQPTSSSLSSSSTSPLAARKIKTDQERGWPLWFPRHHHHPIDKKALDQNNTTSSLSKSNTNNTSRKTSSHDPHDEDSKPSRTLRHALTHFHADHHSPTNTSSSSSSSSSSQQQQPQPQQHSPFPKEDDSKSVEELKIALLESSDHHHNRRHGKKEKNTANTTETANVPPSTFTTDNSKGNTTTSDETFQSNRTTPSATTEPSTADDDDDDDDKEEGHEEEQNTATTSQSARQTAQQQQLQQQQMPNIIVLGNGAPFGMGGMVGGEPPRRSMTPLNSRGGMPMNPNQQQQSPPNNSVLLAELISTVVSTFIRLWFLTWITKRIAMEEESIHPTQHFVWERLNDRYSRDAAALHSAISSPPLGIPKRKWQRHVRRTQQQQQQQQQQRHSKYKQQTIVDLKNNLANTFRKTVLVVELFSKTDNQGSLDLTHMTQVITFVLDQHRSHAFGTNATTITTTITHENGKEHTQQQVLLQPQPLEIVFLIESGGGAVGTYGLAAAQMKRLTQEPGITTTACVDLVAASGGYMIASQATQLLAAPFATLGSIGVMMEGLNFYDALQKYGVSPLIIKSGSSKNPLSSLGPVSRKDMEMEQGRLDKVHDAFRQLVLQGRPVMTASTTLSSTASSASSASSTTTTVATTTITPELEKIMDGSVYFGHEALELRLVDAVKTSEEYIFERIQAGDRVLKLHRSHRARFGPSRRLSLLDLLPHLQSWSRGLMQTFGRWTNAAFTSGSDHDDDTSINSGSASTASLRFVQAAAVMSLGKHLIQHLQQHQRHRTR